jgi:hypothetical protein
MKIANQFGNGSEWRHGGINYLTPNQKLLKLTIEDYLKENPKGRKSSTDLDRQLMRKLKIINLLSLFNLFVTELVG